MGMTKKEVIDMFRNQLCPAQGRILKKRNYEGKGEQDEQEYLRDANIILDLAEKGLQAELIQADYENRLKADLKAILVELQLEIREHDPGCGWEGYADKNVIDCIIQEKINALKGGSDGA